MNPYEEALKILDNGNNWAKGWYEDDGACLISSIGDVSRKWYDSDAKLLMDIHTIPLLERIAFQEFPDRISADDALWVFNDHEDTTWEDVKLVLEKAAAQYEEVVN